MDLSHLRLEYSLQSLDIDDVDRCPFTQFERWYQQATKAELLEPNAMVLATADSNGQPTQRTVLLKYFDTSGFVFFTNHESRKARQIAQNSRVSILLQWLPLQRQVEIGGTAKQVSTAESLRYFVTRPRGSRLGAWVSQQSEIVSSRSILEAKMQETKARFCLGRSSASKVLGWVPHSTDTFRILARTSKSPTRSYLLRTGRA